LKCALCGSELKWNQKYICTGCSLKYNFTDFGLLVDDIVEWACVGMRLPNMLAFGNTVKFNRWHGNYVKCFYYVDDREYPYLSKQLFVTALPKNAKITAVIEFVGNTIKKSRCLVIFSEFRVEDWAFWSDGTNAFKLSEEPKYYAFVEINGSSKSFKLDEKTVFWITATALEYLEIPIREQFRKFTENFYFFPRDFSKYRNYVDIEKFDCIWI